jgi:hypothetical protein
MFREDPSCSCPNGFAGGGLGTEGCISLGEWCGKYVCDSATVMDPVSGLTWQRMLPATYVGCTGQYEVGPSELGPVGAACTHAEAIEYCEQLLLGNNGQWRMPTEPELLSIVDKAHRDPAIDLIAFPNTQSERFWMSLGSLGGEAHQLDFATGTPVINESMAHRVRCVSGR